jgi:hypothetical protein
MPLLVQGVRVSPGFRMQLVPSQCSSGGETGTWHRISALSTDASMLAQPLTIALSAWPSEALVTTTCVLQSLRRTPIVSAKNEPSLRHAC